MKLDLDSHIKNADLNNFNFGSRNLMEPIGLKSERIISEYATKKPLVKVHPHRTLKKIVRPRMSFIENDLKCLIKKEIKRKLDVLSSQESSCS